MQLVLSEGIPMNPDSRRRISLTRVVMGLSIFRKPSLSCPKCGQIIPREQFSDGLRVRCATCGAELVLMLGFNWLYTAICIALGVLAAYLRGLHGPLLFSWSLIYSAMLVVLAAPILAPFFPPKVKLAGDYIKTLRIPTR